jgi:ribonucleoside-diphosphate reductase alpha chain
LYITTTYLDGELFEVFAVLGKSGGCALSQVSALSTIISLALRSNTDPKILIKYLKGIKCPSMSFDDGAEYFSCADAIGKCMERTMIWLEENHKENKLQV